MRIRTSLALLAALMPSALAIGGEVRIVQEDLEGAMEKAELTMQFHGSTQADIQAWQESFQENLHKLLGNIEPPKDWKTTEIGRTEFDDHIRYELVLEAPDLPTVPVYLLLPRLVSPDNPAPAVLCVHGHGKFGHHPVVGRTDIDEIEENIAQHHYDYGLQFVRRGYVVAAPCMIPFGDRVDRNEYGGNDPCAVTFVRMQALGRFPMAENLRDLRWCLDFLQSRPEVDRDRIGCAGLSYGGRMTMLVSAVDPRIKVAAISGALNLQQERLSARHSCGSQIIPGLLKYGDYSEIGCLIAPRPCVWEAGSKDPLIVPKWDEVFKDRLKRAYEAASQPENLHFDHFEGAHRWNGKVAFPLFDEVLKGE